MSGHRWAIPISANYSWFESFVERQNPVDIGFMVDTVDAQPNQYSIVSSHLDDLDDIDAAASRAVALISLLDGAMHLQDGNYAGMYPREIMDLQASGKRALEEGDAMTSPFSQAQIAGKIPGGCGDLIRPLERWVFMARHDALTLDMLRFLGVNGPTWITLYALKDYMKSGGWDEVKVAAAAGVTAKEVERFRHTANNPAAIGPFARHGNQGHKAPAKPMTLGEARKIILTAGGKFLDNRAKELKVAENYVAKQHRHGKPPM